MEVGKDKFKVKAPITVSPFDTMSTTKAALPIEVVVTDYPAMVELFRGHVIKLTHDYKAGLVTLEISSKFSYLEGQVPRKTYGTNCSHFLGDSDCGVNLSSLKLRLDEGDYTIDGINVYSSQFASTPTPKYYEGGFIVTSTGETQYIVSHSQAESKIVLLYHISDDIPIDFIDVYPGCDKTINTCENVFHNKCNFGGFPYIPNNNPYSQGF